MTDRNISDPVLLTPKNIYRLLFSRVFKLNRWKVLPIRRASGVTLDGFWREMLQTVISAGQMETLFPSGKRSHATADLMNRSGPLVGAARETVEGLLKKNAFTRLVRAFDLFLERCDYDAVLLERLLRYFEASFCSEDSDADESTRDFFMSLRMKYGEKKELVRKCYAVRLSWLTLHAFFGHEMSGAALKCFRGREELQLYSLLTENANGKRTARYLTRGSCVLQARSAEGEEYVENPALTPGMLAEKLKTEKKLVLCGANGSGRTELVRRMLAAEESGETWQEIACVQYESDIVYSFKNAFYGVDQLEGSDCAAFVKSMLERTGRGLLLLHCSEQDDRTASELRKLLSWKCDILTVCSTPVDGFVSVFMPSFTGDCGKQIFSAAAGRKGTRNSTELDRITRAAEGRPALIRFLGLYSKKKRVPLSGLLELLESEGVSALMRDETLKTAGSSLFGIVAALPEGSWRTDTVFALLRDFFPTKEKLLDYIRTDNLAGVTADEESVRIRSSLMREMIGAGEVDIDHLPFLTAETDRLLNTGYVASDPLTPEVQLALSLLSVVRKNGNYVMQWLEAGEKMAVHIGRGDILSRLLQIAPEIPGLTPEQERYQLAMKAYDAVINRRTAECKELLHRVLEIPSDALLKNIGIAAKAAFLCEDYELADQLILREEEKKPQGEPGLMLTLARDNYLHSQRRFEDSMRLLGDMDERLEALGLRDSWREQDVYMQRAQACAFLPGRQEEALEYLRHCDYLLDLLEDNVISRCRIRLVAVRAMTLYNQGRIEESISAYEWVTGQLLLLEGKSMVYIRYNHNLCIALTAQGRLDEAEKRLPEQEKDIRELLGQDNDFYTSCMGVFACVKIQRGDMRSALDYTGRAVKSALACGNGNNAWNYRVLEYLLLERCGEEEETRELLLRLQEQAQRENRDLEETVKQRKKLYFL